MPMERRAFGRTGMHVAAHGFGAAEICFENTDDHPVNRLLADDQRQEALLVLFPLVRRIDTYLS